MRALRLSIALVLVLATSPILASHFEFCWLTGVVESEVSESDESLTFSLKVTASHPARCRVAESYDPEDCAQYAGQSIAVSLPPSVDVKKSQTLELVQRLWIDVQGQWWNAWHLPGECVIADVSQTPHCFDQSVDAKQLKKDVSGTPLETFKRLEPGLARDAVVNLVGTPTLLCGSGIAYDVYVLSDGHEVSIAYIDGNAAWAFVSGIVDSERRVLFGESDED